MTKNFFKRLEAQVVSKKDNFFSSQKHVGLRQILILGAKITYYTELGVIFAQKFFKQQGETKSYQQKTIFSVLKNK